MYDRFEILREIDKLEEEIDRLKKSDEDESDEIAIIEGKIFDLKIALEYAE